MTERPVIFSAPMVRAILEGRKSATRRLSKQWLKVKAGDRLWVREAFAETESDGGPVVAYRAGGYLMHGATGERRAGTWQNHVLPGDAGEVYPPDRWRPSIHMPRWASRITLEATEDAREEPLHGITEGEAIAEGVHVGSRAVAPDANPDVCVRCGHHRSQHVGLARGCWETSDIFDPSTYRGGFAFLWDSLHTKPGERWEDNPVVVRVAFRRVQ